jgi:hypothetical protein
MAKKSNGKTEDTLVLRDRSVISSLSLIKNTKTKLTGGYQKVHENEIELLPN